MCKPAVYMCKPAVYTQAKTVPYIPDHWNHTRWITCVNVVELT